MKSISLRIFILISLLASSLSCSNNYERLSWLEGEAEHYQGFNGRSIASTEGDEQCFIDQFEINNIKDEIRQMEKSWKKKVSVARAFQFTTFNAAETNYIKRYAEYISINELAKSCHNLPCVLNSAYGDINGEEGFRIYHWFLVMGSGISTKDKIPRFSRDDSKKFKDYLFPNKELKLLNIMSKTISKKYRDILVSTIHRFPNGTAPGENTAGQFNPRGTTYGGVRTVKHPSVMFFTDQSINFNKNSKLVSGYYVNVIIHELSHALDFTYGAENTFDAYSVGKKWTDLSWKWGEVTRTMEKTVNGVKSEFEETVMQWIPDDTKEDGFIRSYQRTSPGEDFADAGAFYILSPEELKKKSPNKFEVYKNKFYRDIGFTRKEFLKRTADNIKQTLNESLWEIVKTCLIDRSNDLDEHGKVDLQGFNYLKPQELVCLESLIQNEIQKEIYFIKKEQYHGCHYLKLSSKKLFDSVIADIEPPLTVYIEKLGEYKEIQAVWTGYREELKQSCDPKHIYLDVRKNENAASDFEIDLRRCVEDIHGKYTTYGVLFENEKDLYIKAYTFKDVEVDTIFAYESMMKGFKTNLMSGAKSLLNKCSTPRDETLNAKGPVLGNGIFVNSGVLNCINKDVHTSLDDLLFEFLEDKYTLLDSGLMYLTEKYNKTYIHYINLEISKINAKEKVIFLNNFMRDRKSIFDSLYTQLNSLSSIYSNGNSMTTCMRKTHPKVSEIVSRQWKSLGWPKTISKNETSNRLVETICPELLKIAGAMYSDEFSSLHKSVKEAIITVTTDTEQIEVWTQTLGNENNFTLICKEELKDISSTQSRDILSQVELVFVKSKHITQSIVDRSCEILKERFSKQLLEIKKNSKNYSSSFLKIINNELSWQIVTNKIFYHKACMLHAQVSTDKEFISSNPVLKQFNLVSPGLIAKHLAAVACVDSQKNWESVDLVHIQKMNKCASNCETYLAGVKPDNKKWQQYMQNFYLDIVVGIVSSFEIEFEKNYQTCKTKYPYMRFSTMRVNRKNCILNFFEEVNLESYIAKVAFEAKYNKILTQTCVEAAQDKEALIRANFSKYLK